MARRRFSPLDRVLGRIDDLDAQNLAILARRLERERDLMETVLDTLREGVLVLGATQPEWASRARFEGARIAQEVNARNGEGSVLDVKVRVLRIDPRAH